MRHRSYIIGSAAAAAAMLLTGSIAPLTRTLETPSPKTTRRFKEPVNSGPVIDTTKESKRAKRRRIAKG